MIRAALACLAVALVAGCGEASVSKPAGGALYDNAALGRLTWSGSAKAFRSRFVARRATTVVWITADGGVPERRTLQPGDAVSARAGARTTVWRIVQSTEPRTLLAVVGVRRGSGAAAPATCVVVRSIPHAAADWPDRVAAKTRCDR